MSRSPATQRQTLQGQLLLFSDCFCQINQPLLGLFSSWRRRESVTKKVESTKGQDFIARQVQVFQVFHKGQNLTKNSH
jgi:hypothetical protein